MPLITGPIGDFISRNASGISNAGAGLASSGLAGFAQGAAAGRPVDEQRQKAQAEMANQQALRAKYSSMFTKAGAPDYAMLVGDGLVEPGAAYLDYMKANAKGGDTDPTTTIQGRIELARQWGLTGDDARSYILSSKLPEGVKPPAPTTDMQNYEYGQSHPDFLQSLNQTKAPAPPSGYRTGPDGNLTFIPGGPADPSTAGKTTEATRRNQQLASVIVPEAQSLLGDGKNPGTFEALTNGYDIAKASNDLYGGAMNTIGQGPSAEYQQAKNSLKTIIASYLYSVSGATANPGEVETQAAVLTPKLNESAVSIADKKRRIAQMVEAVANAAKGTPMAVPDLQQSSGAGIDDLLTKYGVQ